MARYRIGDLVVDTVDATASYDCKASHRWDGNNHVCGHTGSRWEHQTLYRSRRGRYYVVCTAPWRDHTEWLSPEAVARWLLLNGDEIPAELAAAADSVTE